MRLSSSRICVFAAAVAALVGGNAFAEDPARNLRNYPAGCAIESGGRIEPRASLRVVNRTSHPVYVRLNFNELGSVAANSTRAFTWALKIGRNQIDYGAQRGTNRSTSLVVTNHGPRTCREVRTLNYAEEAAGHGNRINQPRMHGAIVDWCSHWASNCGKGGADQYCRSRGYSSASDWTLLRPGRTWVMGSNRFCTGPACQGFQHVTCAR